MDYSARWQGIGTVEVNGVPLVIDPASYECIEPPRFGEKIATGDPAYADYNPYESLVAFIGSRGGYGVRRQSDVPDVRPRDGQPHLETYGVDPSLGPIICSPALLAETLPSVGEAVTWLGEYTPTTGALAGQTKWVAVAGNRVYYRNTAAVGSGTWTDTGISGLINACIKGAVGAFNGFLFFGAGANGVASYTTDLATVATVTNGASNLYIFAFTADRAAAYIAGGTAATDTYKVMSGTSATNFATTIVCGSSDSAITGLAPGGGIVTVYVGKTVELGCIDNTGLYRVLLPFDTRLTTNGQCLRWWMGRGGDEQRGPNILQFSRDRSRWAFQPSSEIAGTAENQSVWAEDGKRPIYATGITTAILGTARWLYSSIRNATTGYRFILKRDARTGNESILFSMGANACEALGITSLIGTNPVLFVGYGNNVACCTLPLDGESPLDDAACRYAWYDGTALGTFNPTQAVSNPSFDTGDLDFGLPDEAKIPYSVRIFSVLPTDCKYDVYVSYDGAAFVTLSLNQSNANIEIFLNSTQRCFRVRLILVLTASSASSAATNTPQIYTMTVRASLATRLRRVWRFNAFFPQGSTNYGTEDTRNAQTTIANFWTLRKTGAGFLYRDIDMTQYVTRLAQFGVKMAAKEPEQAPDTQLQFVILENGQAPTNAEVSASSLAGTTTTA